MPPAPLSFDDLVARAPEGEVVPALTALARHRQGQALAARVRAAARKSRRIQAIFLDRFGA